LTLYSAILCVLSKSYVVNCTNVSICATLDRWFGHGITSFISLSETHDVVWMSGSPYVMLAKCGLLVLVGLLGIWLFRGPYDRSARATVAEWSTVFLVAAILGTQTWKAYLVVLLLPMTLFVATWQDQNVQLSFRRKLLVLTWLAAVLSLAGAGDLFPANIVAQVSLASIVSLTGAYVLGMLFWYRFQHRRQPFVKELPRGRPYSPSPLTGLASPGDPADNSTPCTS
jgi:hypothetical protein